jgi:hypothetical protein
MYYKGKQELEPNEGTLSYDYSSIDIYTLFRHNKHLGYFEIGPKMSLMSKMNQVVNGSSTDITGQFNKTNFGAALGFGVNLMGGEGAFTGMFGLRFEYGFTDIVAPDFRNSTSTPIGDRTLAYKATNPAFAGIVFELNWGIGYFGVAQCGARSKFIMF